MCLFSTVGCSKQKIRELEISSLYNAETDSFDLHGYAPSTNWREICEKLGIIDKVKKDDKNRFYINSIADIYPNSKGYITLGKVVINGIPARVSYRFYREKLYSVQYAFELGNKKNKERREIFEEIESVLSEEFADFTSHKEDNYFSCYFSWFAGTEGSMSRLLLFYSIDSDSGELHIALNVTHDIPGNERVTTYYFDNVVN